VVKEALFLRKKPIYEKVELIFGEGHGHHQVAKQELKILSEMEKVIGKNIKLTTLTDYFGYIPGVNLMLNLGVFLLSNNEIFPIQSISDEIIKNKCIREKTNFSVNSALFSSLAEGGVYSCVVASK
jgi:hypothetical protein